MSPLVKEVGTFLAWYLALGLPIVFFGSKYLIKIKERDGKKAEKITYLLITAPLLVPMLIGMFGLILFIVGYILFTIFPEPPDSIAIPAMILGAIASVYLGIKAYIAIYKSYMKDINTIKNGAI